METTTVNEVNEVNDTNNLSTYNNMNHENLMQSIYDATMNVQSTISQKFEETMEQYFEKEFDGNSEILKPKMINFRIGNKVVSAPKFSLVSHPILNLSEVKVKFQTNLSKVNDGTQSDPTQDEQDPKVDVELTFSKSDSTTGLDQVVNDLAKSF